MSLDKNYQGTDANLEISLEEYGFVARPVKVDYEDEYFVIYKMGDNQYGSGHIRESELDAIVNGTEWASKEDVDSMLETVGSSKEEWMDLPFESKFSDLVSYWGTENVIGTDYYPNDKKWAFEEIGLEYDSDDEFAKGGGVDITSLKKGDVITILGDSYKFLRYETENDEEKTVVLDLKDNSIVSMPKDMVEAYSKYKFAKGGGVDKELYEITLEDIFSFATQSKTTELTDAQYRSILEQKKNGDIVIDRYNQKQGIHEQLRIKSVTKKFAKGGGVRKSLFSNREYSYGRNWTNDHRHHNKRENYEIPMSNRKRKYADGGLTEISEGDLWKTLGVPKGESIISGKEYKNNGESYFITWDDEKGNTLVLKKLIKADKEIGRNIDRYESIFIVPRYDNGGDVFAKGGGVKGIEKKAEKLLEESISYKWVNTDMGSGWSFELESPLNRSVFNILEEHTYLDDFSPEDEGFEDWDDLSKEQQEYYYKEWKEEFYQSAFENFKEKCMKHLDDFIEYIQQAKDYQDEMNEYAKGGGVRTSLFSNREYSYGRNWTNDHRHQNKSENYEVPMSKRKRKYAEGGGVDILALYQKDKFSDKDYELIDESIENGYIDTTDIKESFMEYVYDVIDKEYKDKFETEDIWEYTDEHYENGLTHKENYKKLIAYLKDENSFAKGGGVRKVNGREYSYGRNWTNDHRHHNKRQNYEVPMSDRKRKYAEGGGVNEIKNYDNEDEVIEDALKYINNELNVNLNRDDFEKYMNFEDKVDFYKTKNNNPETFKKVQDVIEKLGKKLGDNFEGKDSLELEVRKNYFNVGSKMSVLMHIAHYTGRGNDRSTQNFFVFPKYPNKYNEVVGGLRYAEGGGVRTYNGREYSYGRNWTNDHRHQNKRENYEVPMSDRKRRYAEGGGVKSDYYIFEGVDNLNGNPLYRVESSSESENEYVGEWHTDKSDAEKELKSLNEKFAKGGGVRTSLFSNREYSYGRNWTNDHRHHNKREDYEVKMSDRKRKYAEGGLAEMNEDTNLGYTLYHSYDTLKEAQDVVDKWRKESPEFNAIVTKSNHEKRPYNVLMTTGVNMGKRVYADGGGAKGEMYKKFGDENSKLVNFDIDDLDMFETQQYNHFIKSMSKAEALQVLINGVESDYSQLSDKLSEIAEEQYPSDEWYEDNKDFFAKGGEIIQHIDERLGREGDVMNPQKKQRLVEIRGKLLHGEKLTEKDTNVLKNEFNYLFAKGGGVRKSLFSNREYSYGRNWTNDHRHHNKREDYEVKMSNRKRKYADGGGIDYTNYDEVSSEIKKLKKQLEEARENNDTEKIEYLEGSISELNNDLFNMEKGDVEKSFGSETYADGGGIDNFDWEELTYKQKLSLVRESGLKDVVANKSVGVLTSNELSKLKNSVRLNRETKTGKFAKGGMVEMLNNIKENNTISEKEIKLINRRLNAGKVDADTQELIDYIWDNTPVLTEEQGRKGYEYLMNVWKSPTGKTRVNNPFGYREQEVLENYSNFELAGFYKNRNSYIPIYNVIGKDNSFQYYLDGVVNIIGADGGMFAKGGGVRKVNGREYSYGRNWTNDHKHQNKREDYEVPMSDRKRKYAEGGDIDTTKYKKIESDNNIYYLSQKKGVNFTIIERVGKLTDTYKGEVSVQKNIDDITLDEIKELSFV